MNERSFWYVYTNDELVIKFVSSAQTDLDLKEFRVPSDHSSDFAALAEAYEAGSLIGQSYLLHSDNGIFSPVQIMYVYYDKRSKAIQTLSPSQSDEFAADNVSCGFCPVDDLVKEFIEGTENLINYEVDSSERQLKFVERQVDIDNFEEVPLLSKQKIEDFFDIKYNEKSKRLTVTSYDLGGKVTVIFTEPNNATVPLASRTFWLKERKDRFSKTIKVDLDPNFQAYVVRHEI